MEPGDGRPILAPARLDAEREPSLNDPRQDVWHLRAADWLQELSEDEIEGLRRESSSRDYDRGATVFTPENHPHSLCLLERGLVRIYRISEAGDETSFGYVAPGEVFGELTAFGDFPRESFAEAVHPARVWRIPLKPFQRLLNQHSGLVLAITRQIGRRMKRIENRVENLVFRDVRSRVAGILIELIEDFGRARGDEVVLDIELTQSELATLVGSTRQTVNASLGELEREGLVEREGHKLAVLKPAGLARVAGIRSEDG